MRYLRNSWILVAVAALIIAGCASGSRLKTLQKIGAPEWVIQGSGAFEKDSGKIIYGVGSATNIKDFSLLRNAADAEARSEVAKVIDVYTSSLFKMYKESTSVSGNNNPSEAQQVEKVLKETVVMSLSGVELVNHWQDPRDGTLFALAKYELNKFKDSIENTRELNVEMKELVRKNAERAFDDLEKEEAKQRERK